MRNLLFIILYLLSGFAARADEAKPEIFAPRLISAPVIGTSPAFNPDQSAVVFERGDDQHRLLLESHRTADGWSAPQPLPFEEKWNSLEPAWSTDGAYIIFASNRPVDGGATPTDGQWNGKTWPGRGGQLWRSERTPAGGWSAPKPLPAAINSNTSIFEPALTRNGTLYFMQPGEDGKFHLMRAERKGESYAKPEPLPFAVQGSADVDPAVAPDDSYVIFASNREIKGKLSLYVSFHKDGHWSPPKLLPGPVNDGSSATDIHLSPDEKTLYFSRDLVIWQWPVADVVKAARG